MTKKIAHLKENGGRYFYRRRVPERHQKTLGMTVWNRPCGDVSYQKAVVLVTEWAEEDDRLIKSLDDPTVAVPVRQATEARAMAPKVKTIAAALESGVLAGPFDPLEAAQIALKKLERNPDYDDQDRLVRYRGILSMSFGPHIAVPTDPDEREDFDNMKRKLERKITAIVGDRNSIRMVAERYYDFQGIRPGVRAKYRRNIGKLVTAVGDIPITHLTPAQLRTFRDQQSKTMKGTSLASVFTPIKGMLSYAIEEQLIEVNPMIKLPKDNRSIQARKWKPYQPEQVQRLFQAMEQFWGKPMRNLSEDRRKAIQMVVRVIAFSAMRPKEVVWLGPKDVTDRWIKIRESKTHASERCIPLHPEIADFPAFFHAGGFKGFESQTKDRVQSVRHNFQRLTRELMDPPMDDPRQVLYSLRSTFSNAMRRARADEPMRRAILGHSTPGSLSHYDDGPEFDLKRNAIRATDPRRVYADPGEDDDLGTDDE
jgi:integrase